MSLTRVIKMAEFVEVSFGFRADLTKEDKKKWKKEK
jgi:hypothetical protein